MQNGACSLVRESSLAAIVHFGVPPTPGSPRSNASSAERRARAEEGRGAAIVPRLIQTEAVSAICARSGEAPAFAADDVGLGKTITAWKALLELADVDTVLVLSLAVSSLARTSEAMSGGGKRIGLLPPPSPLSLLLSPTPSNFLFCLNYERSASSCEVHRGAEEEIRSKETELARGRDGARSSTSSSSREPSLRCKHPTAARSKLAAKAGRQRRGFLALALRARGTESARALVSRAAPRERQRNSRRPDLKDFESWCQEQGLGLTRGTFGRWEWRGDASDGPKVRHVALRSGRWDLGHGGTRRRPEDSVRVGRRSNRISRRSSWRRGHASYMRRWDHTCRRWRSHLAEGPEVRPRRRRCASVRRAPSSVGAHDSSSCRTPRERPSVAISVALSRRRRDRRRARATRFACAAIPGRSPPRPRARTPTFQRGRATGSSSRVEEGILPSFKRAVEIPTLR